MKLGSKNIQKLLTSLVLIAGFTAFQTVANGDVGEHVNHLSDNIKKYEEEVNWLTSKVDGIVTTYQKSGAKAAHPEALMEHWEAVDFHAAIETNYVLIYASIWQGLYAVKGSIDEKSSIADVKAEEAKLNKALWQALGAVKMAAKYQDAGLLAQVKTTEEAPKNSIEALVVIDEKIHSVVAKYAEQLIDTATTMVHDTYLNLFEGVEGELIAIDANLVEDLEKDFNVTLPLAIKNNKSVDEVRDIVTAMSTKLSKAKMLLENKEKNKKDVF
ncbi:hypothetical protein [Colwellia sp. E2M01]|uniref:hypothetical protein n=1 Tax=Colwellia sp. E2M01 TaxID=2841561 RepID=UPI001C09AD10|nr:hypothetical protein [Colwellia sp. E2M01]MBU2870165.1 hypothetical protein [Colwellia sp. E2M01]